MLTYIYYQDLNVYIYIYYQDGEGWDPMKGFNLATFSPCPLSQDMTWRISIYKHSKIKIWKQIHAFRLLICKQISINFNNTYESFSNIILTIAASICNVQCRNDRENLERFKPLPKVWHYAFMYTFQHDRHFLNKPCKDYE